MGWKTLGKIDVKFGSSIFSDATRASILIFAETTMRSMEKSGTSLLLNIRLKKRYYST